MTETLRYYWQRLAPFVGVYLLFELIELILLLCMGVAQPAAGEAMESLLGFINENIASFIFTILPYLLYLLILPRDFHGSRLDKRFTLILFSVFCLLHWLEELVEIISGDSFHLLTREFIMAPASAWEQMLELPHCEWMALILLIELAVTVYYLHKRLIPTAPVPHYVYRLLLPFITAGAAFLLIHQAQVMDEVVRTPELYEDGLVHIFQWIFDLTAVPDLVHIFATPSIYIGGTLLLAGASIMLLRQNFPGTRKVLHLPAAAGKENLLPMLLLFLACILLVRLLSLGIYPLMDTTEARYGEMARKMVETNNWLQPQFEYGVPFWGKPPLSFWGSAATMWLFGINEFAARLAPCLATLGIGLCLFLWPFPHKRAEQSTAAIIIFLTSAMGFVSAGAVMTDAFLAFGTTLSLVAFYRAMSVESPRRLWGYLFFLGLVIGLLSKGPLALVICGLPTAVWTLWQRAWHQLWQRIPWLSGTLLLLLLTLPWYIAAEQATPGFLRYFIIGEHIERFLVKGWEGDLYGKGHSRAIGTIWLYALEMFLPWVLLVPFIIRRNITSFCTAESRFLWCWALSTPVFFTVARNILPAYILPAVPAFCLLLTRRLWALRSQESRDYRQFIFAAVPMLALISIFGIGNGFSHIQYRCHQNLLRNWDEHAPLYYADDKVPYSAQFYSAGRARILTTSPERLRKGDYLAVHRSHYGIITHPDAWQLVTEDGSWRLYCKR